MLWILLLLNTVHPSKSYNEQERLLKISYDISNVPRSSDEMMTYSAYTSHPCNRICKRGDRRNCYYNLVIDTFYTKADCGNCPINKTDCQRPHCITTDGVQTDLLSYNYMLPGPMISVCEGDTVIVHATNYLSEETTIHYHGMTMWSTPYMDGVPYITQYPIKPFTTFVYNFIVDRFGTMWYHSHFGTQRGFGLFGAYIVRIPVELNVLSKLYDVDSNQHVIVLNDWPINFNATVVNLLVNGRGHDQKRQQNPPIYSKFPVVQNKRYRFRVIFAGTASCSLEFSIQNRPLHIISMDGNDIERVKVSSFVIMPAQRFDFVLEANQRVENYWIRVKGLTGCSPMIQGAVLHYENSADSIPEGTLNHDDVVDGVQVNTLDAVNLDNPRYIPAYFLTSLIPRYPPPTSSCKHYLTVDSVVDSGRFTAMINRISTTSPTVSLIHAKNYLKDDYFCNRTSLQMQGENCEATACRCIHKINLPLNTYCEIFLVNNMTTQHPMHLHGFIFRVVGAGKLTSEEIRNIQQIDRYKPFPRRAEGAPLLDVAQLPSLGYTILWLHTNNSGFWLFHCHIETHMNAGMRLHFKVGEAKDMIPVPKPALTCS